MIAKRTTALIAAMALLTTAGPAVFAQNTSINEDDDFVGQANEIKQKQSAYNSANAGNVGSTGDGKTIVAGNNAAAASFQEQDATALNFNEDNDVFDTLQIDICEVVDFAFTC
jgi:hypothetical protein